MVYTKLIIIWQNGAKIFLRDLGRGLISEHIQNKKENQYLAKDFRKRIEDQVEECSI